MHVELWGGPRDGEEFVVPDNTRYVNIPMPSEIELKQVKATGEVVSVTVVRCYFGRRSDGSVIARWPAGCT